MNSQNHISAKVGIQAYNNAGSLPKNLGEAYSRYIETLKKNDISKLNTALLRFTAPAWGGPEPSGERFTAQELAAAIIFVETIPLDKLWSAEKTLEYYMLGINRLKKDQRTPKYNLRKFVSWASAQGWGTPVYGDRAGSAINRIRLNNSPGYPKPTPTQSRTAMGYCKTPSPVKALKQNEINPDLRLKLSQWEKWMVELGLAEATRETSLHMVLRFLGRLHHDDCEPLESLCLESIVPYIKPVNSITEFENYKAFYIQNKN